MKKKEPEIETRALPAPLRAYLYFTAAVTGAAVMIVEILGAKMLAPYFGTSHFVWTAQIAVTLVALASGYFAGGKWVDRSSQLGRLYGAILIAAVYLAAGVLALEPVAYACFRFNLPLGTLITAVFLFFIPLSLLAMVCPFLIRVLTISIAGVGGKAGQLTAISTIGSFLGTILIGYVLIPLLPNSVTMLGTAFLLILIAALYFLAFARKRAAILFLLLTTGAATASAWAELTKPHRAPPRLVEVHRRNSNFGLLQVLQTTNGDRRYYLNDFLTQNTYDTQAKKSMSVFTYALHDLAQAYTTDIRQVLCIGLGIGIVPMTFANEGAKVDVVEINPAVVPIAARFFDLEPARLHISTNDGRAFLNRASRRYDAIILDAFLGDSSPSHLLTREAFAAMKRVLNPEGTLVINCFADFAPGQDFFAASLDKTLRSVFPSVKIHDSGKGNVFFVASGRPALAMVRAVGVAHVHPLCRETAEETLRTVVGTVPEHGRILTDDYNPLEYYDAANRERIRRYLALSFRAGN